MLVLADQNSARIFWVVEYLEMIGDLLAGSRDGEPYTRTWVEGYKGLPSPSTPTHNTQPAPPININTSDPQEHSLEFATMAPIISTLLASLAILSTAAALPGSTSPKPLKFPSASISLYDKLFCDSTGLIEGTSFTLKPGTCQNAPTDETFISANICLNGAVPKGYEAKVILYSDRDCQGFGTATAPLAKEQDVCALKLTASSLEQGDTVGGQSVGLVFAQLAEGSTVA
ncbi:hypothetical protein LTS10_011687 [Elasticomyces elasticus]|nr:hypothetical protein LTS10_011687 [Elasticomyces elasticus]